MKVLKIAIVAVLLITMLLTLCSCGKFECATCGEEKTGKRYKEEFLGKEILICKECKKAGEELEKELEDLKDNLVDIGELFD